MLLMLALSYFIHYGLGELSSAPTPNISSIHWFPCTQNATWPVTCGSLAVPLDYTDQSSNKTLKLSLLRFNATKQPAKGSVLFNPGGPGDNTKEFLAKFAEEMLIATSGHFDLIAFDPRGTGETIPFSCYNSEIDRESQEAVAPKSINESNTALGKMWTDAGALAEECYEKNKDIGELLGTAFVARDMMQIVDALGEDGLLRYMGFSYGTVLGATVAAMFPDRMDKVVLDGVVNTREWMAGTNRQEVLQTDDAVRAYFKACLADPDMCAIHRKNTTAEELYGGLLQLLDDVKFNGLILGSNVTTGLIQYGDIKNTITGAVKAGMPAAAPLSAYLGAIMERNLTLYLEALAVLDASNVTYVNLGQESLEGIECADTTLRTNDLKTIEPLIADYYNTSQLEGDIVAVFPIICGQWKMRAKERYTGPYQGRTKTPMLLISSPLDPATPMASARNVSAGFKDSVILQQNGIGHCSIAQPSKCVIQATRAYFLNGTLPSPGTVCEPSFGFFANRTIPEIYRLAVGESATA